MRVVVVGAGGVGGTIGGRLRQSGYDVALVARGPHGEAIRSDGLLLATPEGRHRLAIETFLHPEEVTWRPDDVALLATKSQDTAAVARDLAAAAGPGLPVVSAQNGIANERTLARWFDRVYGMCVMMPTAHLEPGIVVAHSSPTTGILDLGRHPTGTDDVDRDLAAMLRASSFESVARPDIMRWKQRKLLGNLGNAVQALVQEELSRSAAARECLALLDSEAELAFSAAGIEPVSEAEDDERRDGHLRIRPVEGVERSGGSTWQSLARGSGVETDYLNGEIALLGREYGVPTPANTRIQTLMSEAAVHRRGPGSMSAEQLLGELQRAAIRRSTA